MAFVTIETSLASAAPIELYKFTGNYNTYRFTSYNQEITNAEGTYLKETIQRNGVEKGTSDDDVWMEIQLPFNNPMVTEYVFSQSPPSLYMELWRVHPDDLDDSLLMWQGQILSWSVSGKVAKMKIPALLTSVVESPIPAVKYQAPCNNILYDDRCQVVASPSFEDLTLTVISIDGNEIELSSSPFADDACNGGEMVNASGSERRMITDNVGVAFTVATAFSNLTVSDTITIRQGCDHSFATCVSKFSNGRNFGGFPLVPDRNPFKGRL